MCVSNIEYLTGEVRAYRTALDLAQARLDAAKDAAAEFHVGDAVEARINWGQYNGLWRNATVAYVTHLSWGDDYNVIFDTKNGSPGKAVRCCSEVRRRP
jgi:hypothetical protein